MATMRSYVFAAIVQIIGLTLFCKGFFPYKSFLPGFATVQDAPPWPNDMSRPSELLEPSFDRLVLIVIDALRNDFILGPNSGFHFVQSLIDRQVAVPFTAHAEAPTVTMPRIKAMAMGTSSSFLDVVLNIVESDKSSTLAHRDNWVYQLKHTRNSTIHLFGDDTWMRILPGMFTKTDGTTSFFVTDTIEVDNNVTRHIATDLSIPDWDAVILHYLGLDHVGHLGGPESPLMYPKQREMDQAVEEIYTIVAEHDAKRDAKGTLIVVCGDHGMNDDGNHGGSSVGETSAAMVFMSPRFETAPVPPLSWTAHRGRRLFNHPVIDQVDLVPTLATLFGFPIPKNNIGKIVPELYRDLHSMDKVLRALQLNAYQLGQLLVTKNSKLETIFLHPETYAADSECNNPGEWYARGVALHKAFLNQHDDSVAEQAVEAYNKCIRLAQSVLSRSSNDYHLGAMSLGIICFIVSTAWLCYQCFPLVRDINMLSITALGSPFAHGVSMFSTSFIEEEQYSWLFYLPTMVTALIWQGLSMQNSSVWSSVYGVVLLALMRLAGVWMPLVTAYTTLQWHIIAVALAIPVVRSYMHLVAMRTDPQVDVTGASKFIGMVAEVFYLMVTLLLSVLVLAYKVRTHTGYVPNVYQMVANHDMIRSLDLVVLARLIYNYAFTGYLLITFLVYIARLKRKMTVGVQKGIDRRHALGLILSSSTPLLILLTRAPYATFFVLFYAQLWALEACQRARPQHGQIPIWFLAILITCLGEASFFLMGHVNTIDSIDLSHAYIGMSNYNVPLIGTLVFASNWSSSLWWSIAGWTLVPPDGGRSAWHEYIVSQSTVFAVIQTGLSISTAVLREHLYIWTVLSPKYLFQTTWMVLFHWVTQVVLGTLCMAFTSLVDAQ